MKENKERESNILRVMYVIFCVTCIWIAARIVYLQCNFIDSDPYLRFFRAKSKKVLAEPTRGAILSSDGRLLAISVPGLYGLHRQERGIFRQRQTREAD